jgi:hypothetical protein
VELSLSSSGSPKKETDISIPDSFTFIIIADHQDVDGQQPKRAIHFVVFPSQWDSMSQMPKINPNASINPLPFHLRAQRGVVVFLRASLNCRRLLRKAMDRRQQSGRDPTFSFSFFASCRFADHQIRWSANASGSNTTISSSPHGFDGFNGPKINASTKIRRSFMSFGTGSGCCGFSCASLTTRSRSEFHGFMARLRGRETRHSSAFLFMLNCLLTTILDCQQQPQTGPGIEQIPHLLLSSWI